MFLQKIILFTFLILYEKSAVIKGQDYLKELKPKEFKFIKEDELPHVELPRPIMPQRTSRTRNVDRTEDELKKYSYESRSKKSKRPSLMDIALEFSVREGLNAMRHLYTEVEPNMVKNGQLLQDNHPAALLSKFSAPVIETTKREMGAYAALTAAKVFRKSYDLNNDLARQAHNQKVSLRRTALESLCPPRDPPTCMPASERYRTHDGTCNNKKRLRWGAAQMPFNRFLPPEYGDGVDTARKATDGGPLSSSRFVSLLVHGARDSEAPLTLMVAQWGQLLDHDMTSTAQPRSINGSVPSCCGSKDFHPSCFPIKVPLDDPWLSHLKICCLEFLRSAPAQRRDCVLSWREQTNQVTSYIDASPIYSSSVKSSDNARVFRNGLLIFGRGNPADDVCHRGAIATHCIRSGDGRSSEQPGLLALHHVWVHEHNYIAIKLSDINLHWSDEKIYQETRRIIGAMFQHITYREFLPIVLGREVLKLFELELISTGYYQGYDGKINPTMANGFAAAAFRFGHSLVQNSYLRCDRFHNILNNNVSLHEEFQRGDIGSIGSLHRLIRGMATQRALKRDEFITPELTNHLFQTPGFPFGLDLAAINIQRGRDHGIPPYTNWRVPCGLSPINTWEDFANVVGPESALRISHAYHSVHDIDLFVAGVAERPVVGGLVGPTFACIIAQQFSNSRKGDRFWYENAGFENSFTPAQLHSIRRVTLASVLCRAVGGGTFQPHIFLPPQFPNNQRLPCGVAPLGDFDIEPWLEQDPFSSIDITHISNGQQQDAALTTFKPQTLTDRIFSVVTLDTKITENINSPLSDNKVGFSNRNPTFTVDKDPAIKPHVSNLNKISDKLDIKVQVTSGQITKQKPIPTINNKLDRNNNHKGGNRQVAIPNTTRRTVVINNIPIELRNAGKNKDKKIFTNTDESETPEPRTVNANNFAVEIEHENNSKEKVVNSETTKESIGENTSRNPNEQKVIMETNEIEIENDQDQKKKKPIILKTQVNIDTAINSNKQDNLHNPVPLNKVNDNLKTKREIMSDELKTVKQYLSHDNNTSSISKDRVESKVNNISEQKEMPSSELYKQTENSIKIIRMNNNLQNYKPKKDESTTRDIYDSDIDPMFHENPIEHKRVQRKVNGSASDQLKKKLKPKPAQNEYSRNITHITANKNKTLTTKSSQLPRTTSRTVELRQYQNRPSLTKTPQKVILDSVNGNSQYEIEINIRQTNKSPKPYQTATNGYEPNPFDRYTNQYQTTPIHGYYQPSPTQMSELLHQKTKPPTIIFVNEHDEHKTTNLPGFLHGIVGWGLSTQRPELETIIGSPLSTANVQSNYQRPPSHFVQSATSSSFSQAQVNPTGIIQSSGASITQGHFGSITGFTSDNGADSIFSFNIKHKPYKTQNSLVGSYGLVQTHRNPWQEQNPPSYDLPYRENPYSPFSTSNAHKHNIRNKSGPQRKDSLTLAQPVEITKYEYAKRALGNVTSDEETNDRDEDYEYDEGYGTSILLSNSQPEFEIGQTSNSSTLTANNKPTFDDNYVLPVLNSTKNFSLDSPIDLQQPISNNFSTDFPDAMGKSFKIGIFAEDNDNNTNSSMIEDQDKPADTMNQIKFNILRQLQRKRKRNRHKNNKRNHEKIAFAPINILTKPERPDNWVFFDSPPHHQEESILPQIPELVMDIVPSAEIPKPFKENIWLDLSTIKRKLALPFQASVEHLNRQADIKQPLTEDTPIGNGSKNLNTLKFTISKETAISNKPTAIFTNGTGSDSNIKDVKTSTKLPKK